jgi:hypothetical protein
MDTEVKSKWWLSKDAVIYVNKVLDEMQNESDRSAAILLGAELDDTLGQILEKHLLPPRDKKDRGAIGKTFYVRIELTSRLGLVHPLFHRELHLIKDVRNEFAHKKLGITFDNMKVQAITSKLAFPRAFDLVIHALATAQPEMASLTNQNSRDRFILSGAILLHRLNSVLEQVSQVEISPLAWINPKMTTVHGLDTSQ